MNPFMAISCCFPLQLPVPTALAMDSSDAMYASPSAATSQQSSLPSNRRRYIVVAILLLVNLLNYMDRFTVSGVLTQLQDFFAMDDSEAGLLQVGEGVTQRSTTGEQFQFTTRGREKGEGDYDVNGSASKSHKKCHFLPQI